MERKKRGERSGERERERKGGMREIEMRRVWERDRWGVSWWEKEGDCSREREGERGEWERQRERRGEYENREGKEKSLKNRCAKIVCLQ